MPTGSKGPDSTKLYGITHDPGSGLPLVIVPRVLKVGIGLTKRDAHVYIDSAGKWRVNIGSEKKFTLETKEEAVSVFREKYKEAPELKFPKKLEYFTFTRFASDGTFIPDFDAIEAHGPMPRDIGVYFTTDQAFKAAYQLWGSSKLKCEGDGINAHRIISMAATDEEKRLAERAKANGERYFPIIEGCYMRGCPYAQKTTRNGKQVAAECKPHGSLSFQLTAFPILGGVARFDTTGKRSISQLFSCIRTFLEFTGNGMAERGIVRGIRLRLVLRPFSVNPSPEITGTAFAVSLEFHPSDLGSQPAAVLEEMIQQAVSMKRAEVTGPKLLAAPFTDDDETFESAHDLSDEVKAAAYAAEFTGEDDEYQEATPEEEGSLEKARKVQIDKIVEATGYTFDQVEECIDGNTLELLEKKYGPAPKRRKSQPKPEVKQEPKPEVKVDPEPDLVKEEIKEGEPAQRKWAFGRKP